MEEGRDRRRLRRSSLDRERTGGRGRRRRTAEQPLGRCHARPGARAEGARGSEADRREQGEVAVNAGGIEDFDAAPAAARSCGRPRSEACRRKILTAALELLEERGLRAMTIEAIADRAGTSKVTVYRWWSHKAA